MWRKFNNFWDAPFLNKVHTLSNCWYKCKSVLLYRLIFKQFGSGSYIRKPMLLLGVGFVSIGERVLVRDGVRLEAIRVPGHKAPELVIGSDTNIEQNVHIVCHNRVYIGSKVSITGHCCIVDVTHSYSDVCDSTKIGSRIDGSDEAFVEIGDCSFIGYGSVILPNVKIGKYVIVGANSVVSQDIPDYSVVAGAPAVLVKRYDFEKRAWIRLPSPTALQTGRA